MEKDSSFVKECCKLWGTKNMQEIFDASLGNREVEIKKRNPKKFEVSLKSYAKWLGENYGPNAKKCNPL